jgi:hypothetical protein
VSGLDIFALIILFVLVVAAFGVWVILAMLPGRIARARNHPQADAINMCGWWGALTMGLLMPLAFIWAHTRPAGSGAAAVAPPADGEAAGEEAEETQP